MSEPEVNHVPINDRRADKVYPSMEPAEAGGAAQGSASGRRTAAGWAVLVVTVALIVLGPPVINLFAPGWAVLAFLLVISAAVGYIDAKVFRFTFSFPVIVGVAYFLAMKMYFNAGTWIYLPAVVVLALAGEAFGDPAGLEKAAEDDEAEEE